MNVSSFLKKALMVWGAITLLGIVAFYVTLAVQVGARDAGLVEGEDSDVRMVHEFFGRSSDAAVEPVYSHHPSGSWSGDYFKAFAVQLDRIEEADLMQRSGVFRGDRLTPVYRNAVEFAAAMADNDRMDWFPEAAQVLSSRYYVVPIRMVLLGTMPDSATMMIARPEDGMVFYIAVKM